MEKRPSKKDTPYADLLGRIEEKELQARLAEAEARWFTARVTVLRARKEYKELASEEQG